MSDRYVSALLAFATSITMTMYKFKGRPRSGCCKNALLFCFQPSNIELINSGLVAECVCVLACLRALRIGAHVRLRANWPASLIRASKWRARATSRRAFAI